MKSYLSLTSISAKVHKKQNRMTIFCIILAVFLVTAVFSMADMAVRMERIRTYHKHGNWHIILKNITESEADSIGANKYVAATSWYDALNVEINKEYFIAGKKTAICGVDKPLTTDMYLGFTKNAYPQKDNEIILSTNIKDIIQVDIGDSILLNTPAGDREYIISGFWDDTENLKKYDTIGIVMNRQAFDEICRWNNENREPVFFVQFKQHINVRKVIDEIKEEYHLADEDVEENTMLLGLSGMSRNSYMAGMYRVAAILFVLILASGVFMIAGSINTSVAERSKFFGMLRCIGASRQQIIHFVHLESLNWCKTAIPIGVGLGVMITWGLCAILHYIVGGEFAEIPVWGVSVVGIISGIMVGLLTVLLAAQSPAQKAAKVSPMAAVSGNIGNLKKIRHSANPHLGRIETALGIHHAVGAKKNLFLMISSFAFSIILFLCFSASLDFVREALPALRNSSPDVSIMSADRSCTVERGLIDEIYQKSGVKCAFGRMFRGNIQITSDKDVSSIDLISYEENQFNWAKEDVLAGDITKVYADSRFVLTVVSQNNPLQVGDKIWFGEEEMEIGAVLGGSPFDTDETPIIICSEETFTKLTGEQDYSIIDVQLTKEGNSEDINMLRTLAGENYLFSDRWVSNKEVVRTYWAFRLFVYGFLIIIAMIAVFNIINSIAMSVSARMKQYGIMRAVGLENYQMTKMIAAEAATYAFFGIIAGCVAGMPLHKMFYETLITAHFGYAWKLPLPELAVIVVLITAATLIAICMPVKRIQKLTIIHTLNE